jgi:hypothetical protein
MAVNAEERNDSGTRGSCFTACRIEELHPTFSAENKGIKNAQSSKKRLGELWQAVAEP